MTTGNIRVFTHITASVAERRIAGDFVEYGVVGHTSAGPTIFVAGSLTVPEPLSKVKMLVQHDTAKPAVGVMASFVDGERVAVGEWLIPTDAEGGDDALVKAANGTRDGLSLGVHLDAYHFDGDDNLVVTAARLYEVSLVTIPAYTNAGVTSVAASHQEGTATMTELRQAAEAPTVEAAVTPAETPAPAPQPAVVEAQAAPPAPATSTPRPMSLEAAVQRTIDHIRGGRPLETLEAALSDTVPAGDAGQAYLGRASWLGELWQASNERRPTIDAIGTRPLVGDKAEGYVWGQKPTVPQYAGNKTAIHSEVLTWIAKSVEAIRFAGGWDIDRKFIDLGKGDILADTYRLAVEDYRKQTEAYASATLQAAATNGGAKANLVALLTDLGALALAGGFNLSFVQLAPALFSEFVNLPEDEVPWWLRNQGKINLGSSSGEAGGLTFDVGTGLPTRGWIAGDRRAATFYEVNPPIRVTAENIPQGGVDLGVFGYAALLVNDATALLKGTVTAPA